MAATAPQGPLQGLGDRIRAQVQANIAAAQAREQSRRTAMAQRAEQMHQHLQATEDAVRSLGSTVIHDFTSGNYQGGADAIRSAVENSVNAARQAGVNVSVNNTGGHTSYGRA